MDIFEILFLRVSINILLCKSNFNIVNIIFTCGHKQLNKPRFFLFFFYFSPLIACTDSNIILLALPLILLEIRETMEECFFRPPGPPGLPFIGNLLHLDKSAPHRYLWQLSEKYGALMFLRLGFVPTLVVSSARMAEEVMKTHDLEFSSRPSLLGQQKLS